MRKGREAWYGKSRRIGAEGIGEKGLEEIYIRVDREWILRIVVYAIRNREKGQET